MRRSVQFQLLFADRYQHVNSDGNPQLGLDRIFGRSLDARARERIKRIVRETDSVNLSRRDPDGR